MNKQDHLIKIQEIEGRLGKAQGKVKIDLEKCLKRLKRELRVYYSYRGNV